MKNSNFTTDTEFLLLLILYIYQTFLFSKSDGLLALEGNLSQVFLFKTEKSSPQSKWPAPLGDH